MFEQFVRFYLQNEYGFAATQLSLAMLGMGATLRIRDFVNVVKFPQSFVTGLFVQLGMVTLITVVMISSLTIATGVIIGLALCAAVPGGTTSNIFTHLGRGNTALSVSLTTVCSIACLLTAPVILGVLISSDLPADFQMPAGIIARDIILNLLIPLALGMLILRYLKSIAEGLSKWSIRLSLLVIVGIVIGASGAGRLDLQAFGFDNVAILAGFITALMLFSLAIPLLLRRSLADTLAISMEVTVRNINLGLLIHVALFAGEQYPEDVANQALLALLLYGALQLLLCIPLIIIGRIGASKNAYEAVEVK